MQETVHCFISGRVQGVSYRLSASQQASLLGITGWIRNLPDGRVELMACADKETLARFRQWLAHGPALANVSNVTCTHVEADPFTGFTIR